MTRQHPARDLLTMPESETCAVCEAIVEEDRVLIEADWGEHRQSQEHVLHARCASAAIGGWRGS